MSKIFIQSLILTAILFLFSTCKKEIKTSTANTIFGRIYNLEGNQKLMGAIKSPDSGFLLFGYVNKNKSGDNVAFLLRLDKDYNKIWYNTYGGENGDYIFSAAFDGENNIIAVGHSYSFGPSVDTNSTKSNTCMYALYVKGNGELIWQKVYNVTPSSKNISSVATKVLVLPNHQFACIGTTLNFIQSSSNTYQPFINCINNQGDEIWISNYNFYDSIPFNFEYTFGVGGLLNKDGNIMLLIQSKTNGMEYALFTVSPNNTSGTNQYISRKVIKGMQTTIGNYYKYPMEFSDGSNSNFMFPVDSLFLIDEKANIIKKSNLPDDLFSDIKNGNGFCYILCSDYLLKTDNDGNILWKREFKDFILPYSAYGLSVHDDESVSFFTTYTSTTADKDIALLKVDKNGNLILK